MPEGRETRKRSDYVSHLSGISYLKRVDAKMDEPSLKSLWEGVEMTALRISRLAEPLRQEMSMSTE